MKKTEVSMKGWYISAVLLFLSLIGVNILAQGFKGNPQKGKVIYETYCLRCHGKALDGKGPESSSLNVAPSNFHAPHSRIKDEAELQLTITRGRDLTPMHSWEDQLQPTQIRDVSAYIRSVIPYEGP